MCNKVFCSRINLVSKMFLFFLVKRVPGRGPEQRKFGKTVLYPLIIIILISYIIIKLLINENHPSRNQKQNSSEMFYQKYFVFSFMLWSNQNFLSFRRKLRYGRWVHPDVSYSQVWTSYLRRKVGRRCSCLLLKFQQRSQQVMEFINEMRRIF